MEHYGNDESIFQRTFYLDAVIAFISGIIYSRNCREASVLKFLRTNYWYLVVNFTYHMT